MYDVEGYLESRGIPYWTSGKNVTQGWVNICCVFPTCDDTSNHLGINRKSGQLSCWKCGGKGNFSRLISIIDHTSPQKAVRTARDYYTGKGPLEYYDRENAVVMAMSLPKEATEDLPIPHQKYLKRRGFNPDELKHRYGIRACYVVGKYRHRVIIPIFVNGTVVNFQALDVTDKAPQHYRTAPNKEAVIRCDRLLYNIDNVGRSVAVVEGVTDVWRIGFGAVAVLGSRLTEGKIRMLVNNEIDTAYIVYDSDAAERGKEVASKVNKLIRHVEYIWLPHSDPDKYFRENPNDLAELRNLLR